MKSILNYGLWLTLFSPVAGGSAALQAEEVLTGNGVRGGQLFDNWMTVTNTAKPDTMPGEDGPVTDTGHGFRCKNCHGWDYRGSDGIYGPDYKNKSYTAPVDLYLASGEPAAELRDHIINGHHGMPAFGDYLSARDVEDLVAFIKQEMVDTTEIFRLSPDGNHYQLMPGGDAEAGHLFIQQKCAICHGPDGTGILVDDGHYTLGSHSRQKAYEDHHKIAYGNPGSVMAGFTRNPQILLNVLTALCDKERYPSGGSSAKPELETAGCDSI